MINKDAIELLLNQGSVLHQLTQPKDGLPVLVARDSHGAVRAQTFEEVPTLEVTLDSVEDLAAWLRKHAHPDTTHILVGDDLIEALLDARVARSHRAIGSMGAHPLWMRWRDVLGKELTQKQALALLRSGAEEISGDMRGQRLRAALGALTVRSGASFKAEIDERGMTRVAAADATNMVDQEIPDAFEVVAPMYVGVQLAGDGDTRVEPHYRIRLEVGVEVRDGRAYFRLTAPNLEVVTLRARQDVALCLRQQLDDRGWLVGLGSLSVERHLQLGEPAGCALASDPDRRKRTPPDFLLGPQIERGDALYPSPEFRAAHFPPPTAETTDDPPPSVFAPSPTPVLDDGDCGPASAT